MIYLIIQGPPKQLLRRFAIEWLAGNRKVSVSIVPKDDEAAKQGQQFMAGISGVIEGQKTIRVELVPPPSVEGKPNKANSAKAKNRAAD
jgi:hypothetical protein